MWRVLATREALKRACRLGILDRLKRLGRDLEERLKKDEEGTLKALAGEPLYSIPELFFFLQLPSFKFKPQLLDFLP